MRLAARYVIHFPEFREVVFFVRETTYNTFEMKRILLSALLLITALGLSAQRDTIAVWNFSADMAVDTIGTHSTNGAALTVPAGFTSSNGTTSAANQYWPYIQPANGNGANNVYGYDGERALMLYGTSSYSKPYCIFPQLNLSQYEDIELVFWARAGYQNSSSQIAWGNDTYQRELCVGRISDVPNRGDFIGNVTLLFDTVLPNTGETLAPISNDMNGTAFYRKISVQVGECGNDRLAFYANCTKKNYIYIDNIAIIGTRRAASRPDRYSITLNEAQWNFDDYLNTKPSVSSNYYLVPQNWIVGNGGSSNNVAAYCPFIYPYTGDATSSYGYDGRLCMRIYHNASANRTAPFAVLPLISDAAYDTLSLTFMGKGETSSSSAVYQNRLRIGYITQLSDTLKANFNSAVVNFHDEVLPTSGYQQFTVSLAGIPAGARVVLYDDDATVNNAVLLDNIRFVAGGGTTPPSPAAPSIIYHTTGCTSDAANATEWDNDEGSAELAFSLEEGFEWGTVSVTIDGEEVADMMTDFDADPSYYANIDGSDMTLYIYYMDGDVTDSVVVTVTAQVPAAPEVEPIPGPATFEEYSVVLPAEGGKYNPYTSDGTRYWQSGDYTFSCTRSWSGSMNDGFYPANWSDTAYADYSDDYKAMPRSGADSSATYATMYYGGSWGGPCTITFSERNLTGTYITLALNPYRCIHGQSWSAAFAEGDYLMVRMSGKKNGVYTGTSAEFYLADYRNGARTEVTEWTWFDLSALGNVDEVEVTMHDSQNGAGVGLYACIDNFGGTAPDIYVDTTATACDTFDWNGQTYTESGDYSRTETTSAGILHTTLHLTINKSTYDEQTITAAGSYLWNGQTYTESGDYTFNGQTAEGCDAVEVLHLTIEAESALGNIQAESAQKFIENGQLYIRKGDSVFDILGNQVR